jgi:hypothetical protein
MIKIKSKMLSRKALIGNTQPGDIIFLDDNLWITINSCNKESQRLIRSIDSNGNGNHENKQVSNAVACLIIVSTDSTTIQKSGIFNWVRCSIETIFKSRRFSQI